MLYYGDGLGAGGPKRKTNLSLTAYSAILAGATQDSSCTVKLMLVLMQAEAVSEKRLHSQAMQTFANHFP